MKKLIAAFTIMISVAASAQTLFYYGNDSVSAKDFLNAWRKNNSGVHSEKSFTDYLHLYIQSRLKVKEAKERGYDTLPQLVSDLENLRQQIIPAYMNDKAGMDRLINEAYTRSQKDIHIAHIFISFKQNNAYDTATAQRKLNAVLNELNKGRDFLLVAKDFSDDPSVATNSGDIGFITVFNLPYDLENIAYSTPIGSVSPVFRSLAGYHIIKNLGERRDPGRMKIAQILLAYPPDANAATKQKINKLADSIYARLLKGDNFGKLAAQFSNDVISASANGQIPEFSIGQYDPSFEKKVFAIQKDGMILPPFTTSYGIHIVKRISKIPTYNKSDKKEMDALKDKVTQSDRMKSMQATIAKRVMNESGFRKTPFSQTELWVYSDSALNYKAPTIPIHLNSESILFKIGDKNYTVNDWIQHARNFRYKPDGSGMKGYPQIWNEFLELSAVNYYQSHLEEFNETFKNQISDFKEGNLFFEIMQRQVWGPSQTDTVALLNYYQANKQNYKWTRSADAVVFYASDAAAAKTYMSQLRKDPSNWRSLLTSYSEKIAADSARFELSQLPNPTKKLLKANTITDLQLNKADKTSSFAYVLKIYEKPEQRTFSEAKGLVINDYQKEKEKELITVLERKYPVKINNDVLNELIRKKEYL